MRKIMLLAALALVSSASACPIKKGYWFNGLIQQRAGLMEPICGSLFTTLKAQVKPGAGQWVEAYLLPNNKASAATLAVLGLALKEKGYEQLVNKRVGEDLLQGFAKGSKQVIFSIHVSNIGVGLTVLGR